MALRLKEKYAEEVIQMAKVSRVATHIDENNVYQPANPATRKYMDKLVEENLLPGSRLEGLENFKAFLDAVKSGKSGLILMEHYSNTDLPELCYFLENFGGEEGKDLSSRIVAIAGMKLNEDNAAVKAFAEGFSRVVIYPTRSREKAIQNATEEEILAEEMKAKKINLAAMRAMDKCKREGKVILVFPSGTRYRPGHPDTKKGLREIDSYLRLFDVMILVSANGAILRIDMDNVGDMMADFVDEVKIILAASPVIDCKEFRKEFMANVPESVEDPKQAIIDRIMEMLDEQHEKIEKLM